jgi:GH25 family lysozyme M1 (1,4-beta-N-acetylmuramidase)
MRGADIYARYQKVTDWKALATAIDFLWIKGTDGAARAPVPADAYVRAAKDAGIPVGLYHFAQLVPRPEAQADILAREVQRLGAADLAPALDIEKPHTPGPAAREFAQRFLARLATHFPSVAIYGNASMFDTIRPDTLGVDNLVIWCAHYGPNDGKRHHRFTPYTGRVDVHQYTDRGRLPGIPGAVDLNHAHSSPLMEDEMTPKAVAEAFIALLRTNPEARRVVGQAVWEFRTSARGTQAQDRLTGIDDHRLPPISRALARIEAGQTALRELVLHTLNTPQSTVAELETLLDRSLPSALMPLVGEVGHRVAGTEHAGAVEALMAELQAITTPAVDGTADLAPPPPAVTTPAPAFDSDAADVAPPPPAATPSSAPAPADTENPD